MFPENYHHIFKVENEKNIFCDRIIEVTRLASDYSLASLVTRSDFLKISILSLLIYALMRKVNILIENSWQNIYAIIRSALWEVCASLRTDFLVLVTHSTISLSTKRNSSKGT